MQRDRQRRVIQLPQRAEHQLGLGARIDENNGHVGGAYAGHDLGCGLHRHMAGPRQRPLWKLHREPRRGAVRDLDPVCRTDKRLDGASVGDGGGKPHPTQARGHAGQTFGAERELVAALGARKRMGFVQNQGAESTEHPCRLGHREQEGEALRRGEHNMRRVLALPDASVRRRVAGARLDHDGQVHLPHRVREVAGNIGGQRLERADVERVQSGSRICSKLHQRRQETGQRLATAGGCDQEHAFVRC
jgi:hypothetical protein